MRSWRRPRRVCALCRYRKRIGQRQCVSDLAKALRLEVEHRLRMLWAKKLYDRLLAPHILQSPLNDAAAVENELRGRLLKPVVRPVPEGPMPFWPWKRSDKLSEGRRYADLSLPQTMQKGCLPILRAIRSRPPDRRRGLCFGGVHYDPQQHGGAEEYAAYFYERGFVVTLARA